MGRGREWAGWAGIFWGHLLRGWAKAGSAEWEGLIHGMQEGVKKKKKCRDFPGGAVVKTLSSQCRGQIGRAHV